MVDRKYLERIEHLIGTGQVFEGSKEISAIRYILDIFQEKIESGTGSGTHIIDGFKEVCGTVDPIGTSSYELFGRALTLVFKDGRKMDFFVTSANTGSITPSSGIYSS